MSAEPAIAVPDEAVAAWVRENAERLQRDGARSTLSKRARAGWRTRRANERARLESADDDIGPRMWGEPT